MFYIGCHLSPSAGLRSMGETALSIGATTLQFFTRNPRGSKAKPIDPADAAALLALCRENGFGPLVAHAPYTINACFRDERTREFARMTLADDLLRMEHLPGNLPPRQPHGTGHGDRHRPDRRNAERHPDAGDPHHRAAGDHGRKGHGGGRYV